VFSISCFDMPPINAQSLAHGKMLFASQAAT
jgi:hypothetical protein